MRQILPSHESRVLSLRSMVSFKVESRSFFVSAVVLAQYGIGEGTRRGRERWILSNEWMII